MSRRSKRPPQAKSRAVITWCWRRWIDQGEVETWRKRLDAAGETKWTLTEKPDRVRTALDLYVAGHRAALKFQHHWGGRIRPLPDAAWISSNAASITKIGSRLEIWHNPRKTRSGAARPPRLTIPHGMAFGSGEHSTTYLLLRELAARSLKWDRLRVLDLGTGSGVLALAARLFGARTITATDFDPDAIRVAKENEALNFATSTITWRRTDVLHLKAAGRYDLVLANLFSGILGQAASQIVRSIKPGGELWMSGILRDQEAEVRGAYARAGLNVQRTVRRGKWILLQGQRDQVTSLGVK